MPNTRSSVKVRHPHMWGEEKIIIQGLLGLVSLHTDNNDNNNEKRRKTAIIRTIMIAVMIIKIIIIL